MGILTGEDYVDLQVQTRSTDGAIQDFETFREALDYANKINDEALAKFEGGAPLGDLVIVWKISFSLPNGERIRLVKEDEKWILRQMEDEVEEILKLKEEAKKET